MKSLIPRTSQGSQNLTKLYLSNLDIMDLFAFLSMFTTCLVMMSTRSETSTTKKNRLNKSLHVPGDGQTVHEQDHDETDHPDNSQHDLENHLPHDVYPMQDSDIEDLLETQGQYSAKMASTYHISKHSAAAYGSLVDRGVNRGLAVNSWKNW